MLLRRLTSLRPALATTATAVAVLALTACTTGPAGADGARTTASGNVATGADPAAYPVTIEHAFGSTTIEQAPTRVAVLGWSDADHVAALGVSPVGAPKVTWGGNAAGSTDWFDAQVATFGGSAPARYDDADGAPVEEIAQLAPDLILATNSGITKEEYDKLSKLAPVVAYPEVAWGTPWQESLRIIGKALGRSAQAEQVETRTEKVLADARTTYPQLKDKTFIYAYIAPTDLSQIGFYTPDDLRPQMLTQLGMKNAPVVEELAKDSKEFYLTVSAEKADTIESDVLLTYITDDKEVEAFTRHPLVGRVPAIAAGAVVATKDTTVGLTMSSPTPLSIPHMVERFVPLIAEAVGKAGQD